jgi:hypothetical protein
MMHASTRTLVVKCSVGPSSCSPGSTPESSYSCAMASTVVSICAMPGRRKATFVNQTRSGSGVPSLDSARSSSLAHRCAHGRPPQQSSDVYVRSWSWAWPIWPPLGRLGCLANRRSVWRLKHKQDPCTRTELIIYNIRIFIECTASRVVTSLFAHHTTSLATWTSRNSGRAHAVECHTRRVRILVAAGLTRGRAYFSVLLAHSE